MVVVVGIFSSSLYISSSRFFHENWGRLQQLCVRFPELNFFFQIIISVSESGECGLMDAAAAIYQWVLNS